ncbi:CHASE domain-containing protein [Roseovarius sp. S4756]|uniref:CHASE domain-containing protein n=1 Tax=Roseovarius maritimus TaxID=3342637 RepID=UPI0037262E1C
MDTYLQSLQGTTAFFRASQNVARSEFDDYVRHLRIDEFLPGVSGIGFVEQVEHSDLEAYLEETRRDGQPGYAFRKLTDAQTHYFVKYIYPVGANRTALGLDVTFEPERRAVLEQARETGEVQLTPPIRLVQHDKEQAGFLLMVPYYKRTVGPSATLPVGRGDFVGWVYAPFIAKNLLSDLTPSLGESYSFQLFDGPQPTPDKLIFEDTVNDEQRGVHAATYTIMQFGRPWTMVFTSTTRFDRAFESSQPLIILLGGILITALLLFLFRAISRRSEALMAVADLRARQIETRERENHAIVENDVTAVFVMDKNDHILFSNRAAQMMLGYNKTSLSGLKFSDIIKENENDTGQQPYNAHGHARNGRELYLDLQRNNWVTADGLARVTAIVRDVTTQIEAQTQLKRTKILYDMSLEAARIGVFDYNLITGKMKVAGTWLRNMGVGEDCEDSEDTTEVDAESMLYARVHPDDLAVMRRIEKDCLEGRKDRAVIEYRLKYSSDEWRWISSEASIVERAADGTAIRMIGIQWDVTELSQARNAMEVSEQRFRQVLAAAPVGMALVDSKGRFITVNDAFCTLCGISEERITKEVRLADMMPREDIKEIYKGVTAMMKDPARQTYSAEHRIAHANGEIRWGLFNISWTYDRNTDEHFYITQINDITDQKKLDQIKSEFVATVSHELRTPLTSIKGALELLKGTTDTSLPKKTERLIEIARSNTDRLSRIVNDILDLEKISSGEVSFNFETVDLAAIISAAAEDHAPFAQSHANRLRLDLPDTPLCVHADASRIKQVLANLISNACKYSSENTEVLIKAERIDGRAIVYVQNYGPGVSESFRPKIFQAFSQADSSDTRAIGGTGLGLNISKRIIKRHSGDIGFESVRNGVTVFWFTCPLSKVYQQAGAQPLDASIVPFLKSRRGQMSVLHFEKDQDFAEVIASALAPVAKVIHAATLSEASRIAQTTQLDAVILDCTLPGDDARRFLDDLATLQPNARLIGLSADEDRARDPRLLVDLIKSRSELRSIVTSVRHCLTRAS